MLITFEGIDGVGKTTQVAHFAEKLRREGHKVFCTREPGGGGIIGRTVRELLKIDTHGDALTELILIYGARRQHVKSEIEPALQKGMIVLCDRYFDSSVAYLARDGDVSSALNKVQSLHTLTDCVLMPDLTFLLDLDPEVAHERTSRRFASDDAARHDKHDNMTKSQKVVIRNNFLELSTLFSQRISVIDGTESVERIESELWRKWLEIAWRL